MITGAQIAAGRALLGWSLRDLARHAGMDIADVQDAERSADMPKRRLRDLPVIQRALEEAGVAFIDSVGVQLLPREFIEQSQATGSLPRNF